MPGTLQQSLTAALVDSVDVQAVVGDATIVVRDFQCYSEGLIAKVNGSEPDGIHNVYYAIDELEGDLARVVPGYEIGASIWHEVEDGDLF